MDKDYNKKRINPAIWQHDYHVLKRLYEILNKIITQYSTGKKLVVVDYGCGSSPYKHFFSKSVQKYIGVDITKSETANLVVAEDKKIPLKDKSVDLVLSTQVLEHISNVDFYLSECKRLIKKNGMFVLSTHGIWPYHRYPDDFRRWTRFGLVGEIENQGFKILETHSILGPFASSSQFELLLIAERLIGKGLLAESLLKWISIIGNIYIYIEDKLSPPTDTSDASLYVICAKKK